MITESGQNMIFVCCDCVSHTIESFSIFNVPRNETTSYYCKDCGKELARITTSFNKYVIYIFCPICEEFHRHTLSKQELFGRELFTLKCPQAGCDILFVGKNSDRVFEEYEKNTPFFERMLLVSTDTDIEEYDLVMNLLEILTDYVRGDLAHCACSSKRISLRYEDNLIKLVCLDCGRTKHYEVTKENYDLLERDGLVRI